MTQQHNGNGHGAVGLVSPSGQPLLQDEKMKHLKLVLVPPALLSALLQLDGKVVWCEGFPDGAEPVGFGPVPTEQGSAIGLMLYHPSFPIVPQGVLPPIVEVKVHWRAEGVATEPAPEPDEGFSDDAY